MSEALKLLFSNLDLHGGIFLIRLQKRWAGSQRTMQVNSKQKIGFKIGIWNVRTLLNLGKTEEVKNSLKKVDLNILQDKMGR